MGTGRFRTGVWAMLTICAACSSGGGSGDDGSTMADGSSDAETTNTDGSTSETGTTSTDGTDTSSDGSTETGTDDHGSMGSPGCGEPSPGAGKQTGLDLDVDGETRSYDLFVPAGYDPDVPAPPVLNFHGLLGTPSQQADLSDFDATADGRGIVVAYPEGIGESFNAGACCGTAESQDVDDVGFSRALVEAISADLCIDPKRVYATGMSNGGHMVHTLGCEAADVFAAVASVTGVMGLSECSPARPISVLDFHGTGDLIVPYGGAGPGFPPVDDMMADWAARNGCDANSSPSLDQGDVQCETWSGCSEDVEVTLCTVDGGGHCWPGNPVCLFGSATTDVDASEMIADFFLDHPLP